MLLGALTIVGASVVSYDALHRSNSLNAYGQLPSWLPDTKIPVQRTLVASIRHSRLGIGGDTFEVVVPTGHVLVAMSGPLTPPFVTPPPPITRATFDLTFSKVVGVVPIRSNDFGIIDGNGDVFYAKSFVGGIKTMAAPLHRAFTLQVSQVMATGTGSIAWAPNGHDPIVTWEYTLEND